MNHDQKEAFLNETYSRVEGIIGPERAAQMYSELSGHIDLRQSEFESRGLQSALARHAAMQSMGTPREIAKEFAKQSVSEPWLTWPIWVFAFGVMCYLFLTSSPSQGAFTVLMVIAAPILLIQGFRNRAPLPVKPLLWSALAAAGALCFVEARSVRLWADRIPYRLAHQDYLSMKVNHAKYLAMEGKLAAQYQEFRTNLIDQELHEGPTLNLSAHRLTVPYLEYQSNPEFARIARGGVAGCFSYFPSLTSKQYPVNLARAAIEQKLATMAQRQQERRAQMNWVGVLINTPSYNRMINGLPYVTLAVGGVFAGAYVLSLAGATLGVAAITRRRRIFI